MIIPFAEWLPDLPDFQNQGALVARNVIPHAQSYLPLADTQAASTALNLAALGSITLRDSDDVVEIFAADKNDLYRIDEGTFNIVSKAGGYDSQAQRWSMIRWGEKIIAATQNEPPQIFDLTTDTLFSDLAGSPPQGRHLAVVRDFVVIGNLEEGGTRIANKLAWSGINDETQWGFDAAAQSDSQILQGDGGFIQAIVGGEYGVIIQDNSIWRMTYEGPPTVFQFDEVETGRGTTSPQSVVSLGNEIYYLGKDGFYMFDGNQSHNISANKVSKTFFNDLDNSYLEFVTAALDPINTIVVWSYHGAGNTGLPNKLIIYNWSTGRWSDAEVELEQLNVSRQQAYTLESLDNLSTSLDGLGPSLDSRFYKGGSILLSGFNSDHKLIVFTGAILPAEVQTGEVQLFEGRRALVQSLRPLVDGPATVAVCSRSRQQDPVIHSADLTVDAIGKADIFDNNRYHRFIMKTTGDFSHIQGINVIATPDGEV